jgi:hypothetical protein
MASIVASSKNVTTSVVVLLCICSAHGSVFLGRDLDTVTDVHMDVQVENFLLTEMEKELGATHRTFTEKRLEGIKRMLKPVFELNVEESPR